MKSAAPICFIILTLLTPFAAAPSSPIYITTLPAPDAAAAPRYPCLPAGINENTVIEIVTRATPRGPVKRKVTVKNRLEGLRAKCRRGKLIDRTGRPVRFYHLTGCWGNPPENYQEVLEKQGKEIAALKRRNILIEIPCNPDPLLPPANPPRNSVNRGL